MHPATASIDARSRDPSSSTWNVWVRYGGGAIARQLTVSAASQASDVIESASGLWRSAEGFREGAAVGPEHPRPPQKRRRRHSESLTLHVDGRRIRSGETMEEARVRPGDVLTIRRPRPTESDPVADLIAAMAAAGDGGESCGDGDPIDADAVDAVSRCWTSPPMTAATLMLVDAVRAAVSEGRFELDRCAKLPTSLLAVLAKGAIANARSALERITCRDYGYRPSAALVDSASILLWVARARPEAMVLHGVHSACHDAAVAAREMGGVLESIATRQVKPIPDSPGTQEVLEAMCAMFVASNAAAPSSHGSQNGTSAFAADAAAVSVELLDALQTAADLPDALWMDRCCCRHCARGRREAETHAPADGAGAAAAADDDSLLQVQPVVFDVTDNRGARAGGDATGGETDRDTDRETEDETEEGAETDAGTGHDDTRGGGGRHPRPYFHRRPFGGGAGLTWHMVIDRADVLRSSYRNVMASADDLEAWAESGNVEPAINVRFLGEDGYGDGVVRDWLSTLVERLFDAESAVFAAVGDGSAYHIAPTATPPWCWFAGAVLGLCGRCGVLAGRHLSSALLRAFQGRYSDVSAEPAHLQQLDAAVAATCARVMDAPDQAALDALGLPGFTYGDRELLPGGELVPVTMGNRALFRHLVASAVARVHPVGPRSREGDLGPECARSLRNGFLTVLGASDTGGAAPAVLETMTPRSFNRAIGGPLHVSGDSVVKAVHLVVDRDVDSAAAVALASAFADRVMNRMTEPKLRDLLRFWTGAFTLPPPSDGPRLQLNMCADRPYGRRPTSHTCFLQLVLPVTHDPKEALSRLDEAIANCDAILDDD